MESMKTSRIAAVLVVAGLLALTACGGGTGVGPGEIEKREARLRDRLPTDWNKYNTAEYEGAIEFFTKTLEQADALEGVDRVKDPVKSEAQSGIGWSFFQLQNLAAAEQAFAQATALDRQNADAWAGWAGVALAQSEFNDVAQFSSQALETDPDYNSATRVDDAGRLLGHDNVDERHLRLMLAEAFFQLGRYSAVDRADPNNAAAQVRLVNQDFRFKDPGQLLQAISDLAVELQSTTN